MFNRAYRRAQRERKLAYAFDVRYRIWGDRDYWAKTWWWPKTHDLTILSEAEKRDAQDNERAEVLRDSVRVFNTMRRCSCVFCRRYGGSKTKDEIIAQSQLPSDYQEFYDVILNRTA